MVVSSKLKTSDGTAKVNDIAKDGCNEPKNYIFFENSSPAKHCPSKLQAVFQESESGIEEKYMCDMSKLSIRQDLAFWGDSHLTSRIQIQISKQTTAIIYLSITQLSISFTAVICFVTGLVNQ